MLYKIGSFLYFLVIFSFPVVLLYTETITFDSPNLASLIANASMLMVGIVAIVISLRVLLIQTASSNMTSGFFKLIADDVAQNIAVGTIILITLGLFAFSITMEIYDGPYKFDLIKSTSILLIPAIGLSLWCVSFVYYRIKKRIDPESFLPIVRDHMIRRLRKEKLKRVEKNELVIVEYFGLLFDYHDKALHSKENLLARQTVGVIGDVVESYLVHRSDSITLKPSAINPLVSESSIQSTLQTIFEQLELKGKAYLRSQDDIGIRQLLRIFCRIATSASKIKFTKRIPNENPILDQCTNYLMKVYDFALYHDPMNEEGVFQGIHAIGEIGEMSARSNVFVSTQRCYEKLAISAVNPKLSLNLLLFETAVKQMIPIWTALAEKNVGMGLAIKLKSFSSYYVLILRTCNDFKDSSVLFQKSAMIRCTADIYSQMWDTVRREIGKTKRPDSKKARADIVIILEAQLDGLESAWRDSKISDGYLLTEVTNFLENNCYMILLLINSDQWLDQREDLEKFLSRYIWEISRIDVSPSIASQCNFTEFVPEVLSRVGIKALQSDDERSFDSIVDILDRRIKIILTDESLVLQDFEYGKLMTKTCLLGILAHATNRFEIRDKIIGMIETQQEMYNKLMKKSGLPQFSYEPFNTVRKLAKDSYETEGFLFLHSRDPAKKEIRDNVSRNSIIEFIEILWSGEIDRLENAR